MNGIWLGLWSLLCGGRQRPRPSPGTPRNRWRPQLETLEDRLVLSPALAPVFPGVLGVTILPRGGHLFVPKVTQFHGTVVFSQLIQKERREGLLLAVPDLSNLTFSLLSEGDAVPGPPPSEGNPGSFGSLGMHTLTIENQEYDRKGTATFDGFWDGFVVSQARLAWDAQGVSITFTWLGHALFGHITATGAAWHLDAQTIVTETIPGFGDYGHVAGGTGGLPVVR
jgi:hypothetical protein